MIPPLARAAALLIALLLGEVASSAYMVRTPYKIDELAAKADIVFKATAVSAAPGLDPSSGATVTQFHIISVIKGTNPGDTVKFDHLDHPPDAMAMFGPPPINYHFDTGKTYIVFAKASSRPGVYEPLWQMPESEGNQGVFSCADDKPAAADLKTEVWNGLTGMLTHTDPADVLYAIGQLDQLSGQGWGGEKQARQFDTTLDFDRKPVVDAVHGFVTSSDPKIAQAAIFTVGSHNPYMTQERAGFWLATVGSAPNDGLVKMDAKMTNPGAELYWSDLLAAADKGPDHATRALAIRALGLARKPEIGQRLPKYLTDTSPDIRAAAMVVLTDYPDLSTSPQLSRMGVDPDAGVRIAVAQCIGFGQNKAGLTLLSRMITDPVLDVRKAAAQSLLSFSARDPAVADVLHSNLLSEFNPVFVIALARVDAAPYLDNLLRTMESWSPTAPPEEWWWGGRVPAGDARDVLFAYLRTQSDEKLKSGSLDRYLDAMDKGALGNMGLGNSFEVYAFYCRHGLTARAQALRQAALKAFPYQQAISYDQAEQHPEIYDQ